MQKKWSKTLHSSSQTTIITIFIITATVIFPSFSYGDDDWRYSNCSSKFFNCGNQFQNLTFPFWGDTRPDYCGHPSFGLHCDETSNTPVIEINSIGYRVIDLDKDSRILRIAGLDFAVQNICPDEYRDTVLDNQWFDYTSADNITTLFYDCPRDIYSTPLNEFDCKYNGTRRIGHLNVTTFEDEYKSRYVSMCKQVAVPILEENIGGLLNSSLSVSDVVNGGFDVKYDIGWIDEEICGACVRSGGACGYNSTRLICYCEDGNNSMDCYDRAPPRSPPSVKSDEPPAPPTKVYSDKQPAGKSGTRNPLLKLVIGIAGVVFGIMLVLGVIFICRRRRHKQNYVTASYVSRNISSDYNSSSMAEDLENRGSICGVHLFGYAELVEATNNFDTSKELGDGGFGTVYYGKLKDGRDVAVKRLYENNFKRVEQFMNEVKILTLMHHPNLVILYGCTSRHSQELLLVYEYISNGTVADHLHGDGDKHGSLNWSTRLKIAIETANALVYLHASDVVHRDVKTTNILLDKNFCVKVADFGLSRLFPTDMTHVSTAPQGTPGYVDPDYHQCYQLTDKSDVYSLGVVMIELISSKPAVDITRHRHEINLSNMAITKIQNGQLHELVDMSLGYKSDRNIKKMINAVAELAFQCLQSDKDLRPTMVEVFDTLVEIQKNEANAVQNATGLPHSPDSVITVKWASSATTPNQSV